MKSMLPDIDVLPIHEVKLEVMEKVVKYKPFTIDQEKMLLMALEGGNVNDIINNYKSVINSTVIDPIEWDNMSLVDFVCLVINLRSKSKGQNLELKREKCKNCEKPYENTIPIENSLEYKDKDNKKTTFRVHDKLSFELKPISHNFLYGLDTLVDEIDLYKHTAVHSISKIMYDSKIYKIDFDNVEEVSEKVISKLSLSILTDMFKKCKEMISLRMVINFVCPFCKTEEKIELDDYLKLLK